MSASRSRWPGLAQAKATDEIVSLVLCRTLAVRHRQLDEPCCVPIQSSQYRFDHMSNMDEVKGFFQRWIDMYIRFDAGTEGRVCLCTAPLARLRW